MKAGLNWHCFFGHWQKDLRLWVVLMVGLTVIRIALVVLFGNSLACEGCGFSDVVACILGGMRFDGRFALLGVAPTFVLAVFAGTPYWSRLLDDMRFCIGWLLFVITLVIGVIDIGFFYEYHDQFNQWVFGVIYDDWRSLVLTVWHNYPVVWIILGFVMVGGGAFYWFKSYLRKPFFNTEKIDRYPAAFWIKCFCIVLMLFGVKCAATCTLGWHSLSRKDTAITSDVFLNSIVYNPYYALYSTVKDFKKRNHGVRGLETFIANGDILGALKKVFPEGPKGEGGVMEDWLERRVGSGANAVKPQHIFLVVMESQDSWPLLEAYSDLNLASNLRRFASEGIYVKSFISAGVSTMPALSSIIMGIPDVGIETQYQPSARKAFSTAIANQFKALGYEANLFYAGYLSWRKIGELALNQGFDHVYGCASMSASECNAWGANDKAFYEYVFQKVEASQRPTFNLLMTASNHPPYSIDPQKEGWSMESVPDSLKDLYDGEVSLRVLGHFWYGDKCLGEFVDRVEGVFPQSLFAITGDHWSRRFLNSKPTLYERKSVPLIFYGPSVLRDVSACGEMAGCHLDIAPTLINLIAPEGFHYYSMGSNILDPERRQLGFGANVVVTPESIVEAANGDFSVDLSELYNAFHGIGWWRVMKGSELSFFSKTE